MIKVVTLKNTYYSNTYLVGDEKEVIIIDPSSNIDKIKYAIKSRKLLGVFLTHGHYDHFKTLNEVLSYYDVKCYLHQEAYKKLSEPRISYAIMFGDENNHQLPFDRVHFLKNNELITFSDDFQIKVLYTPGHTNCSVVYLIDDIMFSGDTLFKGTVGRTDLATSNHYQLFESINQLLNLKTNYVIYPGHEEPTTLVDEQLTNPFYKLD